MLVNRKGGDVCVAQGKACLASTKTVIVTTLLCLFFALTACGEQKVSYPARQPPAGLLADAAQVAAGKALFREKCASCHGHPDEGRSPRADFFQPAAPDFSAAKYRRADPAYLFWRIEVGKTVEPYLSTGSVMPSWRGLSDTEIWRLVAYLQTRSS